MLESPVCISVKDPQGQSQVVETQKEEVVAGTVEPEGGQIVVRKMAVLLAGFAVRQRRFERRGQVVAPRKAPLPLFVVEVRRMGLMHRKDQQEQGLEEVPRTPVQHPTDPQLLMVEGHYKRKFDVRGAKRQIEYE